MKEMIYNKGRKEQRAFLICVYFLLQGLSLALPFTIEMRQDMMRNQADLIFRIERAIVHFVRLGDDI